MIFMVFDRLNDNLIDSLERVYKDRLRINSI